MMIVLKHRRTVLLLLIVIVIVVCCCLLQLVLATCNTTRTLQSLSVGPKKMKIISSSVTHTREWYKQNCLHFKLDEVLSIEYLHVMMKRWQLSTNKDCIYVYNKFVDIYNITWSSGKVVISNTFKPKVLKWLNNNRSLYAEVLDQHIISIFNKYTHENTIFNPVRAKRPGVSGDKDVKRYVDDLINSSKQDCDFCAYKTKTAEDSMGRIESKHSVTAANTFKFDAHHELILIKQHNCITFTEEQFLDAMNTAKKWFNKVYEKDKSCKYPQVSWDNLPKASASQIHPHAQATLRPARYHGLMEHLKLSAMAYREHTGSNFFTDLIQIHTVLGLTTTYGNATALAYLTPKKDHEIFIISQHADEAFFRLLYYTIKAFMDDLQLYAWSFFMILPEMGSFGTKQLMPAIVRIISRGPANVARNDISSLELFGASNVNIDPFSIIAHIEESVTKRGWR
ncbi:uncharacterized protein LOC102808724 [Saccoglossus kowalevskii]|uniref:Uncharacterized protein LOC102808724 n=1 Tax=Saccoglossus kowalevskii TaxID=10224 RepID=A0ABM0MKF8_SACKO|nr:PREDICTED: uncharacterized protein LOC102808724 [Saccoglossus kowalevskii]